MCAWQSFTIKEFFFLGNCTRPDNSPLSRPPDEPPASIETMCTRQRAETGTVREHAGSPGFRTSQLDKCLPISAWSLEPEEFTGTTGRAVCVTAPPAECPAVPLGPHLKISIPRPSSNLQPQNGSAEIVPKPKRNYF